MSFRVLTDVQIEQFITHGFLKLEAAFPREYALAAQDFLWERLAEVGVRKEDSTTWVEPMVHLKEAYRDPIFQRCMTERLRVAIEDLVGAGRWGDRDQETGWGWWPINFALGADKPWDVPTAGWHWDGMHFRHIVTAPNQGLLLLPHFSSVGPHGGGTLVAAGSHQIVARFLSTYPEGIELNDGVALCNREHPWLAALTGKLPTMSDRVSQFMDNAATDEHGTELRVVESIAEPGDVIICHPFLYHAPSQNHSGVPRFMCNRTTPLKEPMCLERANGDYSPVEDSIRRALAL